MRYMFTIGLALLAIMVVQSPVARSAEGQFPVESGFLSVDMDQLTTLIREDHGVDLKYIGPNAYEALAQYKKIMVDQPEIWLDQDSDYRGVKPDDQKALADLVRDTLIRKAENNGYEIVEAPGPDVLYMRVALTDLFLKKKKRGILGYTPIGAVVKLGADAAREMMEKVDIIELALQVEFQDSQTQEVLAAIVVKRGARKDKKTDQKRVRIDFDEFNSILQEYSARLVCRLENAKLPDGQSAVDCLDDDALEAAGYLDADEPP